MAHVYKESEATKNTWIYFSQYLYFSVYTKSVSWDSNVAYWVIKKKKVKQMYVCGLKKGKNVLISL